MNALPWHGFLKEFDSPVKLGLCLWQHFWHLKIVWLIAFQLCVTIYWSNTARIDPKLVKTWISEFGNLVFNVIFCQLIERNAYSLNISENNGETINFLPLKISKYFHTGTIYDILLWKPIHIVHQYVIKIIFWFEKYVLGIVSVWM